MNKHHRLHATYRRLTTLFKIYTSLVKSGKKRELIKKRRDFFLQFLNAGDIFFDIGANYGNRIEPIINEGIKIIAVEPQDACAQYLKTKYKNKITVESCGLSDKKGIQKMYISNASPLSSFSKEWIMATQQSGRFRKYSWHNEQLIEMDTLDNLIKKYGKPKFIKIDVEGYEYEVLKGLSDMVKTLSFEYTIPERKQSVLECIDRIIEIGGENNILFNYSAGESMKWALDDWITSVEMKEEIEKQRFVNSEFGDIYVKTKAH